MGHTDTMTFMDMDIEMGCDGSVSTITSSSTDCTPTNDNSAACVNAAIPSDETRITLWNRVELRKISGDAAPKARNVQRYIKAHPNCEVYDGQDRRLTPEEEQARAATQMVRVPIFNRRENVIYSGNAAPLEKNLDEYLRTHPDCEVYISKRKRARQAAALQTAARQTAPLPGAVSQCPKSFFPLSGLLLGDVDCFELGASFESFETQPKKAEEAAADWDGWESAMCCGAWEDIAVAA